MPLWADADLAAMSPEVAQRIISILTKCTKGIDKAGTSGLGRSAVRPLVQPDPTIVQQIVEIGFPAARAEQALRRVGLSSSSARNFGDLFSARASSWSEKMSIVVVLLWEIKEGERNMQAPGARKNWSKPTFLHRLQ